MKTHLLIKTMGKRYRYPLLSLLAGVGSLLLWLLTAAPSLAHWADLAAAEVIVGDTDVQITLTYPTQLTTFADEDSGGALSNREITRHTPRLETFFADHIRLTDSRDQLATAEVRPAEKSLSAISRSAPDSHTTVQLTYRWSEPHQGIVIDYRLFPPEAPEASCVATVFQAGESTSHIFTPQKPTLSLIPGEPGLVGTWLLPLVGAFVWGAIHSLSPGHGKTLIGAYLVGERATPLHALFLAMTITITHTVGVLALGVMTLAAAQFILPEQLYPWLSLVSGSLVVLIGVTLFWQRYQQRTVRAIPVHAHGHHSRSFSPHTHAHSHAHSHRHIDGNTAQSAGHSHLPPDQPLTWGSLLLLGVSIWGIGSLSGGFGVVAGGHFTPDSAIGPGAGAGL